MDYARANRQKPSGIAAKEISRPRNGICISAQRPIEGAIRLLEQPKPSLVVERIRHAEKETSVTC